MPLSWLTVTSTHGSSRSHASIALSIRLPSTVTISWPVSATSSAFDGRWVSSVMVNSMPRSSAWAVLPSSSATSAGSPTATGQPVDQLLGQLELVGGELHRFVGAAHLDHRDDGVQLVGGLVRLRAQRVGQHLQRAEFAKCALQFGAVADRDHLRVRRCPSSTWERLTTSTRSSVTCTSSRAPGLDVRRNSGRSELSTGPGRKGEQPAGLVVDQRHPVAVEHDQPLGHRMQDRVVVLVHHPQFVGAQSVCLPQQPAPDQPHPDQRNGQRGKADRGDRRELRAPAVGQAGLQNARRHQPDDSAGFVAHRGDRADRRAQRAGVDLGERLAAQRGLDGADVLAADLRRIGVGEPGPVRRHDRDERDVGVRPHRLGDRLQNLCRPSGFDGLRGRRRVGERGGDADDLLACGGVAVLPGVEQRQRAAGQHDHRDHQDLQGDRLAGQRAGPPPAQDAPNSSAAIAKMSSPAPTATK